MASINLIPIFLTGLVGSLHCLGMCGGIVSAFSMAPATTGRRAFPLPVIAAALGVAPQSAVQPVLLSAAIRALSYNSGRISSYMLAGALAGGVGGALALTRLMPLQAAFYWLANLMLVILGLYMMDVWRGLTRLENAGQFLWYRIYPFTRKLLPLDSYPKFFAMGALWGWLPCGMVYATVLTAMLSGSARSGAMVMLAFGGGTLPALLALGAISAQLKSRLQHCRTRLIAGAVVLGFGVLGLARAGTGHQASWLDAFCISASASGPHSFGQVP